MEGLSSSSIMSGYSRALESSDHINELPNEVIQYIFCYLSPKELEVNSIVCKKWWRLSSDPGLWNKLDLTKIFPTLRIFDASDWAKQFRAFSHYGLELKDELPIDTRTLFPILKRFSSLPIEKIRMEDLGFTILTIPKGLTLKKLVNMAQEEDKVKIGYVWGKMLEEIGDLEVKKTYRILITNNVLEGSRNLSPEEQKGLVEKVHKCERPKVIEMLALLVTTFAKSGKRFYNNDPCTYTSCLERVSGSQVVVGGFASAGLFVVNYSGSCRYSYGVGAVLREF